MMTRAPYKSKPVVGIIFKAVCVVHYSKNTIIKVDM